MAKALKIGASLAAIAAVTIVTGGAALGLGVSLGTSILGTSITAGTLLTASAALGAGASLLAPKPKAPSDLTSTGDRLTVSIHTREPRKIVLGSTAMAADVRDQEYSNDQTYLHRFIVVASHKVHAIRAIYFDDKLAWTVTGGAQGEFKPWLQVTPVLEGSAINAVNLGPRMGGARRYTGCAYIHIRYQILANSKKLDSVFNQSIPSRITIVGDGAPVYDPRRDSTVPGGSGPQRANDQSTWAWDASASRNPALGTLFYLLGWRINGRLAVGKGIPPARLDLASFIEAANLCDEPVARSAGGTEPRYRCDGVISEGDATDAVLDNLKASMNAVLDDIDGRLRLTVLHNDLAAPIGDLDTSDVLGKFTWQQTLPLNDSVNVIRGGYIDPSTSSLFQLADYPEVAIASRDGIERSQTINYPLVQSPSQAQRLTKQRLQRMLYGGTFAAVFQSTAWKYQKGDVIRFTFRPLGWDRKLFRIADMATQVDGKVPLMLREENAAIYAWDASDAAPVTGVEPTRYDASLWPLVQGVTEAGKTAEWDKVEDPNNTKPEDNATVGAPPGTIVGDRLAEQIASDLDLASLEALATATLAGTWRAETDEVTYAPDGKPIRTQIEQIGLKTADLELFVSFLKEVNASKGTSKFVFAANADGAITGIEGLAGGGMDRLAFMSSRFYFVDNSGQNPVTALSYENGVWKLKSIEVDTLKVGSVLTDSVSRYALSRAYATELPSNKTLPFASGSIVVAPLSLTKERDDSDLEIEWMMRMRPGGTYAGYFELLIAGAVVDQVWYWAGTAEIDSVRSVRSVQPYRRRFPGIAGGPVTLQLRFTYWGHDGGTGDGFIEGGSIFAAEEIKR